MRALAIVLFAAGCSSGSAAPATTICNETDRHGTYLMHLSPVSGNCGPVPDALVDLAAPSSGCVVTSTVWSDGNCKLDRTVTCTASDGTVTKVTAVTMQQAQDGSSITGEATFEISGPAGSCLGTYDVTYTRQ